jgi:hypothetical protein
MYHRYISDEDINSARNIAFKISIRNFCLGKRNANNEPLFVNPESQETIDGFDDIIRDVEKQKRGYASRQKSRCIFFTIEFFTLILIKISVLSKTNLPEIVAIRELPDWFPQFRNLNRL